MLSKSQARTFFLAGTILFSGVFLLLTVDTIATVPKQTHAENLTPEVIRGKDIFDHNNCMGCHTLMGEGAYYAPELTKVFERRGPVWMKQFLKNPEAMYPGERKMVNYHFKDQEIEDLIAFFKWIGEMDLNGFPAKPDLNPAAAPVKPAAGAQIVAPPAMFTQICSSCHSLGGAGGAVGPALDGTGSRRDAAWLDKWLLDPAAVKPGTTMPKLPMTDAERKALVDYLLAQK